MTTYPIPADLNKQEAFDTMLAQIRKQGRPALSLGGLCSYRGNDGTKCAVGALIPDDQYNRMMEGQGATALVGYGPSRASTITFLAQAQMLLHDSAYTNSVIKNKDFLTLVEEGAQQFAKFYNLTYTQPEKEITQ